LAQGLHGLRRAQHISRMGNVDGVPLASQVKSAVQASRGDTASAWATQEAFTERCIGAAQVKSVVQALQGDHDAAAETQRKFLANARRLLSSSEVADAVPLVSQVKAMSLIAGGTPDERRAAATSQRNFSKRCPFVSQGRSVYELATKGPEEAMETQKEFLNFASSSLDKVPVLGHFKAWGHAMMGDEERGEASLAAADASVVRGVQMLSGAVADIFGEGGGSASASPFPESQCNTCGPLDDATIRRNTLLFEVTPEQLKSHSACPICMVDFALGEEALTLRCFHVFHPACGDKWLQSNGNCPVCRVGAAPVDAS